MLFSVVMHEMDVPRNAIPLVSLEHPGAAAVAVKGQDVPCFERRCWPA
jgi:hypothetical protein